MQIQSKKHQKKVFVMSIDGMCSKTFDKLLKNNQLPNFFNLISKSSWSYQAQTEFPTESYNGWTTIFKGQSPTIFNKIGYSVLGESRLNRYGLNIFEALGGDSSIFLGNWARMELLVKNNNPNHKTELFKGDNDKDQFGDEKVFKRTMEIIKEDYSLIWSYFDGGDEIAHLFGVGKKYENFMIEMDHYLGKFIKEITEEDYIFIVSDHGRDSNNEGKSHNAWWLESTKNTVFIAYGPKFQNRHIGIMSLQDIAPTILYCLEKKPPITMKGKNILIS